MERRTFVRGIGAMTVAGALAGCSGGGDDGGDTGNGDGTTTSGGDGGGGNVELPSEVEDYVSGANNFDGGVDRTGQDSVEISVGAGDRGWAFDPVVAVISTGTEVRWVWTGQGAQHNVEADDGSFESDLTASQGFTFTQTFEEAGNVLYFCDPHQASGMLGALVVE